MIFWKKVLEKCKEYWQVLVGLAVGLTIAFKLWWRLRAQKKVLKNEIITNKKISAVEEEFTNSVANKTELAEKDHELRKTKIEKEEKEMVAAVEEELDARIEENRDVANEELARRIANSLNVNVVLEGDGDDS